MIPALNRVLAEGIRRCKSDLSYTPTYFIRMLSEMGPVGAVRELVSRDVPSEGFDRLALAKRLELTVEFVALRPEFSDLFGDLALAARQRLERYGFDVDAALAALRS